MLVILRLTCSASSSWKFKAPFKLARNTAQEAPSPGAGGVRVGEMEVFECQF
jgi:hypothetical protein